MEDLGEYSEKVFFKPTEDFVFVSAKITGLMPWEL